VSRQSVATLAIVALAIAASVTSLANGFAYDDQWIIVKNTNIHELGRWWRLFGETYWPRESGSSLYRPMTALVYAIQWAIGGGAPWPFHVVNVALYAVLSWFVYSLARLMLSSDAAWLAAALFAVHPVHVEAVGNSIGQAELWTALTVVAAVVLYVRARRRGGMPLGTTLGIAALYGAACLFKEHGVVLPVLLLAAEFTVVSHGDDAEPSKPRQLLPIAVTLIAIGIAFIVVRSQVVGSLAGDASHPVFTGRSMLERCAIMLGVLPDIARLLIVPIELRADYSPRDIVPVTAVSVALLPGLIILIGVIVLLVRSLRGRRAPAVAFGLLWLLIAFAPVSNILIATGVVIAERTLLLPSVGAMLAIGGGVEPLARRIAPDRSHVRLASIACAVVILSGLVHSARWQLVWRSTSTVVDRMLRDAPLNYKTHFANGALLFEKGDGRQGELEWRLAIRLFPEYYGVYASLAERYREGNFCEPALPLYKTALTIEPRLPQERAGYTVCLLRVGNLEEARAQARIGASHGQDPRVFRYLEALADSALAAQRGLPAVSPGAIPPGIKSRS
jgi:protein O-mannosyl-transferase